MTGYVTGGLAAHFFLSFFRVLFFSLRCASAWSRDIIIYIDYMRNACIYLLLTHHPATVCAMGKPSTLHSDHQTVPHLRSLTPSLLLETLFGENYLKLV